MTWDDANNQDGKRPASITINLLADGTKTDSKVVKEADGWKWSFENLDKFKDGREIAYTIEEETVAEYTSEVDGYNVTNRYTPGKTQINVAKVWKNDKNTDCPESVVVKLLADNADTGMTVTLNKANGRQAPILLKRRQSPQASRE